MPVTFQMTTVDEIRTMVDRLLDQLDREFDAYDRSDEDVYDYEPHDYQRARVRMDAIRAGVYYVSACSAALEAPELIPYLLRLIDAVHEDAGFEYDERYRIADAIGALVAATTVAPQVLESLVRSRDEAIRMRVGTALDGGREEHRALLTRLLRDVNCEVRARARAALGEHAPWWAGIFAQDPVPRLPADIDEQAVRESFDGLIAFADKGLRAFKLDSDKLGPWLAPLPDALAFEVYELWLADLEPLTFYGAAPLAALLERPGSEQTWLRLLQRWCRSSSSFELAKSFAAATAELGAERQNTLIDAMLPLTSGDRKVEGYYEPLAATVAQLIEKLWPAVRDPAPLLDLIEAMDKERAFEVGRYLIRPLAKVEPAHVPWQRLTDIVVGGFEGVWSQLSYEIKNHLARAPREVLEPLVRRILAENDDDAHARWALEQLIALEDDANRRLEPWLADERCRRLIFSSHSLVPEHLAELRAELRAGRCSLREAGTILGTIARTSGGLIPNFAEIMSRVQFDNALALGAGADREPSGEPITDEEWQRFRELREAAPHEEWASCVTTLPAEGWTAEDEAYVERVWQAWKEDPETIAELALATVLFHLRDVERLEMLIEHAEPGITRRFIIGACRYLGNDAATSGSSHEAELEWMDLED